MGSFLKFIPVSVILTFVSGFLIKEGTKLKNQDENATGKEDAAGNIMLALAPVLLTITDTGGSENAFKKSLRVVRDTINTYLNEGN